jgi:hypothetical protein
VRKWNNLRIDNSNKIRLIYCLFFVASCVSMLPFVSTSTNNYEIIYFQVLFFMINLAPLIYTTFIIKYSHYDLRKKKCHLNGQIMAATLFIISHVVFNFGIMYILNERNRGFSTSVIAYLFLPIVSVLAVVVGYGVGYFGSHRRSAGRSDVL